MIKDVIRDGVSEWLDKEYDMGSGDIVTSDQVTRLVDSVYAKLADKVGAVQEKLLADLQLARSSRDAAEREAAHLKGLLAEAVEKLNGA